MKIMDAQYRPVETGRANTHSLKDDETGLEQKKLRLRKAAKEFESYFVLNMLKAMRKTIPKSEFLGGGLGEEIYTSMFDEELSKSISGMSEGSLAAMLYHSLERHLEASERSPEDAGKSDDVHKLTPEVRQTEAFPVATSISAPKAEAAGVSEKPAVQTFNNIRPKITNDPILSTYGPTIDDKAREYDVDPKLVYAIIKAESNGQADAVSAKGAKGLMQLMDGTAEELGVADSLDPGQNIAGGTKYLGQLLKKYDGDVKLAVAAYNAGPGTVSKYNGVPPYSETRDYVDKVLETFHSLKKR